jgi:ribosomal protein L36
MLTFERSEEKPVKCSCGKLIAIERNGRLYVFCKKCRREVELEMPKNMSREA